MTKSVVAEGKTSTEAIEKGLKMLNVSKNMVDIKILEEDKKRSYYSILSHNQLYGQVYDCQIIIHYY